MKILIGCDEKSQEDKLSLDFERAGFPEAVEVFVLSVADVFIVPGEKTSRSKQSGDKNYLVHVEEEIRKAKAIAGNITKKLKIRFPLWRFHAESAGGSAAWEILNKAREHKVDMIVVGSHGRSGVGELFFGSVALKVLAEAHCSVRIVRPVADEKETPARIVIAADGSPQSDAGVNRLVSRQWRKGSATHLVTAVNAVVYTAFFSDNYFAAPLVSKVYTPDDASIKKEWRTTGDKRPTSWIKKMHKEYKAKLQDAGLIVTSMIKEGDPKIMLMDEARRWCADCIYLGAAGHSRIERIMIGSVSVAVASRAHCSVEVIR